MAATKLTLAVTTAWWLRYYMYGVASVCALFNREPNWDRVQHWIQRAVRVKAIVKE